MSKKNTLIYERWLWWYLYGDGKRSAKRRREYHRLFKLQFPKGHEESLRHAAKIGKEAALAGYFEREEYCEYLRSVHPDAFEILARYGLDYTPRIFRKPAPFGAPRAGQCYLNASLLARYFNRYLERHPRVKKRQRLVYVEGIVIGPPIKPMAHGWNARGLRSTKAIDWTLYATCKWIRYIGIPLTVKEHAEIAKLTGRGNIFDKKYFNAKAKKRLVEILEARRKKKSRTKSKKKRKKATR